MTERIMLDDDVIDDKLGLSKLPRVLRFRIVWLFRSRSRI
jgi:hypothetical protein